MVSITVILKSIFKKMGMEILIIIKTSWKSVDVGVHICICISITLSVITMC